MYLLEFLSVIYVLANTLGLLFFGVVILYTVVKSRGGGLVLYPLESYPNSGQILYAGQELISRSKP